MQLYDMKYTIGGEYAPNCVIDSICAVIWK